MCFLKCICAALLVICLPSCKPDNNTTKQINDGDASVQSANKESVSNSDSNQTDTFRQVSTTEPNLLRNEVFAIEHIKKGHPKLILTDTRLNELKSLEDDEDFQYILKRVLAKADELAEEPLLEYEIPDGKRLLEVSRKCLDRVQSLGLAYRYTGDTKYFESLKNNLLAVCAFDDWNPSHFLDTAEMTEAVALGYDWAYNDLSVQDRETIRHALITHGLKPGIDCYEGRVKYGWWVRTDNNWNFVCNSAMITGALAVADTDPQYAEVIIPAAIASMPVALEQYGPDGAWPEGPGYWGYSTLYIKYGVSALESATDSDYGLLRAPGLSQTGLFPIISSGPTGRLLSYSDCGGHTRLKPTSTLFWYAKTFNSDFVANKTHELLRHYRKPFNAGLVIWYTPKSKKTEEKAPLDYKYNGRVELAFMRSSWDDPDALFVGIKAGDNTVNHAHLDLGNFELDALGVRWARDLGMGNYNLKGYFDHRENGQRWQYYRPSSHSHNVLTVDNQNQSPLGNASITRFEAGDETFSNQDIPFVEIDLTNGYNSPVSSLKRGVALVGGRKAVLIQDEISLEKPVVIDWGMTTEATEIKLSGAVATLLRDGKRLHARILSPAGAVFSKESTEQSPPQKTNEGILRLAVHLPKQSGNVTIAVLLSPVWPDGYIEDWNTEALAYWGDSGT